MDKLETWTLLIATPIRIVHFLLYPFAAVAYRLSRGIAWLFGIKQIMKEDISRNEEELRLIVSASEQDGEIDQLESTLIDNVFEFTDSVARDVMVPRQDMACLYTDDTLDDNLETVRTVIHTRYPLCNQDKDHVIGVIHVRDLLDIDKSNGAFDLTTIMRDFLIIPESMRSDKILELMKDKRVQIAIVTDEYGGTTGLVTLEDLLEEIVGEIQDEEEPLEPEEIVELPDGNFEFDGEVLLDEVADRLQIDFDKDMEEDTIGGYVFSLLGRKPEVGDEVWNSGWRFEVLKMDHFRIARLRAVQLKQDKA